MIDISVFGATVVRVAGSAGDVVNLAGIKPKQILEMLAVELGSPVSKDVLAERLWDGSPPSSYVGSLESYVCVLRRRLTAAGTGASPLVTTHGGYMLDPTQVHVDLADVQELMASLTQTSGERLVAGAETVLDLITGELLADERYADWAVAARRGFGEQLESLCTHAADVACALGATSRAIRLARTAVRQSPLSEPAARALMSAYQAAGSRPQALEVYADLRAVMAEEFGVEPSGSTRALYLDILSEERRPVASAGDHVEMHALVRLLRQALESGVRPDNTTRSWLAEVGALAMAQTA